MTSVNTYLTFNGNCMEAFNFYKSVLGGEFAHVGKFSEMPSDPNLPPVGEEDKDKIMHISYPIGNTVLMGSDTGGEWAPNFKQGNNFSLSISAESKADADRIFNALSEGGKVVMPMADTFWESYFGMFTDKFGINWMVSYDQLHKDK